MQTNSLKRILGKAAYSSLIDFEIRTTRRIMRRDLELAKWYTGNFTLREKLHRLHQYLSHSWNYTRHLTDREMNRAYGRKAQRFDRVDFIRNRYSPYLPR